MHIKLLLLTFAFAQLSPLAGETMQFREFNFTLESPSSWQAVNPPPANAIGFTQSTDKSKGLVIMAFKFPENKLSTALQEMIRGAKESAIKQGISVQNEKSISIADVPFQVFTTTMPNGVSIVSYMGLADNIGFSLQGFSKTSDAGLDPEITNFASSFKLINKSTLLGSGNKPDNEAFRFGTIVGRIAVCVFIIGALWIFITKKKNKLD